MFCFVLILCISSENIKVDSKYTLVMFRLLVICMTMAEIFRLKWSNHMNNVLDVVKSLFSAEALVDVTLACDGMSIKAHKVILSACSPFFQSLLIENPCQHPIIIIPHMKYNELKPLIEFMYEGEISVSRDQLATLMKNAQNLKIKGLAEISFEKTFTNESPMVTEHEFNPPTEISSPSKYTADYVQEQPVDGFNSNDGSKVKSGQSDIENLSDNVLVNTTESFMVSKNSNSLKNSALQESTDIDNSEEINQSNSEEQVLTPNKNFSNAGNVITLQSKERNSESNVDSFSEASQMSMPFEAMGSNDQSECLPEIQPDHIESDPSMSPIPGPSHDTEDSMMMDHSSISSHPEVYEEGDTNFGPLDYQPEENSSIIRTIYFSKDVPDNEEPKSEEEASTSKKKWKYKCYKCDLLVASKGHLNIHMRTHTGERPFSCHVCGKTAIRQHDLQLHMRTHSGIKPYACPICGMKFNNSSNYRRHYKRRHPTAERVVQVCKVCDEQFDSKELLHGHLINQHQIENSHVCVICQKSYKRQYDLKTHLRVHSKEKPYACKVCFKLFSYKSNQIRHIRQHYQKSKFLSSSERQPRSEDPNYIPESDA